MHARYGFIHDSINPNDARYAAKDWIHRNGDANNGFEMGFGMGADDSLVVWEGDQYADSIVDERGHDTFESLKEWVWEVATREAFVEKRRRFYESHSEAEEAMSSLRERILEAPPAERRELFAEALWKSIVADMAGIDRLSGEHSLELYDLRHRLWLAEEIATQFEYDDLVVPFAQGGSPYMWRFFDVRAGVCNEPQSIAVVEIHT